VGGATFPFVQAPIPVSLIYNDSISSQTRNVIVLVLIDPLHTWSESGEELLDKTDQVQMEISFILSQRFDRFWSQNS